MSLITVVVATQRQERGWDDPSLPIAVWQASGVAAGDGSGGIRALQVNLQTIETPAGLAYSLEQVSITDGDGNAKLVGVLIANLGRLSGTWVVGIPLVVTDEANRAVIDLQDTRPSLFLGLVNAQQATASLSFVLANVASPSMGLNCSGYIWGPRSVATFPGGYQRPVGGMFGI